MSFEVHLSNQITCLCLFLWRSIQVVHVVLNYMNFVVGLLIMDVFGSLVCMLLITPSVSTCACCGLSTLVWPFLILLPNVKCI